MAEMQEKMMMKLICVSEGFEDAGKADLTILPFADGRRSIWHPCLKGRVSASGNLEVKPVFGSSDTNSLLQI